MPFYTKVYFLEVPLVVHYCAFYYNHSKKMRYTCIPLCLMLAFVWIYIVLSVITFTYLFYFLSKLCFTRSMCNINILQVVNCIWVIKNIIIFSATWYLMDKTESKLAYLRFLMSENITFHLNRMHKKRLTPYNSLYIIF